MDKRPNSSAFDGPGALSLDQILAQVSKDDQEEWEYEYSIRETEVTFYLTLELSYPEFKERPTKAHHHSRGGYYKNWQDNDPSQPTTDKTPKTGHGGGRNQSDDDDGDGDGNGFNPADPEDEGDGTLLDPALRAMSKGKEPATDTNILNLPYQGQSIESGNDNDGQVADEDQMTETEDIQILELHSRNPIISYRGRLFEGNWAEVIGTEAILAQHSSADPLPALRNLPGDIDLLAASSSRILTTEKIPKPNVPEHDTLAPIKEEWNVRIPAGKDRTGERAEQTSFLENLIALKMKRGDKDQVTVYATDGAGKDWDDRKGPDFKPRKKKNAVGEGVGGEHSRKGKEVEKRPRGRPGLGKKLKGYPVGFGDGMAVSRGLSTPTPRRWEDLKPQGRKGDQASDEDEDDEDSDDMAIHD